MFDNVEILLMLFMITTAITTMLITLAIGDKFGSAEVILIPIVVSVGDRVLRYPYVTQSL